ncbi:glycoside hydrolase family 2 TIM barrel-domain containing protein [Pollutibacter soli]|uniref:glycoside hydrolase family 2 TIM barrel-domain containing protein n=1 Tax=Pollutibacter soli TaxID=3034157 RepID=UPI00301405C1
MRGYLLSFLLMISVSVPAQKNVSFSDARRNVSFDLNWRFLKDSLVNAEQENFDDSRWRKLDLPHDWSIEDLPRNSEDTIYGPFDKKSVGAGSTGFTVGGTGWYRKKFVVKTADLHKNFTIYFDGVYMNADVWVNGHHLGNHPYGYTPFYYDLTPYLHVPGQENVIAVRVKNKGKNSRWYSGSGIYRNVKLFITDPLHIEPWGVYITTPQVSAEKATVHIRTSTYRPRNNQQKLILVTTIFSDAGRQVGKVQSDIAAGRKGEDTSAHSIVITRPALWSVETPVLYKAVSEVKENNKVIDRVETNFGIRSISFSAEKGFLLNGKKLLLKGGCVHHDNGPLGAAVIYRAEERKIQLLKKNGFNAVRTSHNPPSAQFLEACDRLGMLVINEAFDMWEHPKNPEDYHLWFKEWWKKDLDAIILRDRNHPSVIIWSVGNEVYERADSPGIRIARQLTEETRRVDPTRPVTVAHCEFWQHPGYKWDTTAAAFALLDIGGYNYMMSEYESDHKKFPDRIILGTESHALTALENWNLVEKHPYVIGDFVWTAFDYMGEASIGHTTYDSIKKRQVLLGWPWFNGWCGDLDLIGNKKPQSYYRDIVWHNSKIEMAVHRPVPQGMVENVSAWGWPDELQSWTWPGQEGRRLQVRVFSRAPIVRLLLNDKVMEEKTIAKDSITATFEVPYQPGVLKAVSIENGRQTGAVELKTTGAPTRLRLVPDRPTIRNDRNDLCYVMVEVVDENGAVVPETEIDIRFSINGPGKIAGVANANPVELASFQQPHRRTFNGRCLVIVQPVGGSGPVTLKAIANGLKAAEQLIKVGK